MTKDKGENSPANKADEKTEEVKISNFAAKLGEETGGKYQVYVYRVLKDEESGRTKKPFVIKYTGQEPDPAEIAERFRGGQYLLQFIWTEKDGEQGSKGFTLDIDGDIFPPLPKQTPGLIQYGGNQNLSENMTLQLAFLNSVSEVLKAAYSSGGGNQKIVQQDPLDAFGGMLTMMETTFKKAMTMQSTIYERVFMKGLEDKYGLAPDGGALPVDGGEGSGLVGQYAPLIREVVDGLKTVVGLFGTVPPDVVKRVKKEPRFQELLKNKEALIVIGAALRKQFGDEEAIKHMRAFGVEMVFKKPLQIAKTPDIGGGGSNSAPGSGQRAPGAGSAPGQGSAGKVIPGAFRGQGKGKGMKG
jgi:hypothetical protein